MPPRDQRSEHTVEVASHYCLYSPLDDHNPVIAGYTANYLMQQLNEGDSYHPHPNKIYKTLLEECKSAPFSDNTLGAWKSLTDCLMYVYIWTLVHVYYYIYNTFIASEHKKHNWLL